MSIRRTLLVSLLTGLLTCAVIITFTAYFNTAHEMHELFSDGMKRMAIVIRDQVFVKKDGQISAKDVNFDELEESSLIQIWDGQGKLQHSSPQKIELPLQPKDGFSTFTIHGQKWNIYTLKAGNDGFVQIAQPRRLVATMIGESATRTLIPIAILFIVLGFGAWIIVGRSVSPLSDLSRLIANRNVDQLRPLSIPDVPNEVQPIVLALNELLKKLDQAMVLQRQFTADAAHELRTPLTAVKLQVELLSRAQSASDRDDAIEKLSEGINRSINMASQLLSASRAGAVKSTPDFQPINLYKILLSSIMNFVPIASTKNIKLIFEPCDECTINGDEDGMRTLINNLLDNAVRHTPADGQVTVSLYKQDGKGVLKVTDTGPGVADAEKNKIFQRFYRVPGTSMSGAGLGLAIVKDVANNHGAIVTVANGPRNIGTTFSVVFRYQSTDRLPDIKNAYEGFDGEHPEET